MNKRNVQAWQAKGQLVVESLVYNEAGFVTSRYYPKVTLSSANRLLKCAMSSGSVRFDGLGFTMAINNLQESEGE